MNLLSFNIFCRNIDQKYVIRTHNTAEDIKIKRVAYITLLQDKKLKTAVMKHYGSPMTDPQNY